MAALRRSRRDVEGTLLLHGRSRLLPSKYVKVITTALTSPNSPPNGNHPSGSTVVHRLRHHPSGRHPARRHSPCWSIVVTLLADFDESQTIAYLLQAVAVWPTTTSKLRQTLQLFKPSNYLFLRQERQKPTGETTHLSSIAAHPNRKSSY